LATDDLDFAVWQALEICKGDALAALRMVLVANSFYEAEIEKLKAEVSTGYARRKAPPPGVKGPAVKTPRIGTASMK
jgi:hypothetical protein